MRRAGDHERKISAFAGLAPDSSDVALELHRPFRRRRHMDRRCRKTDPPRLRSPIFGRGAVLAQAIHPLVLLDRD